MINGPPEIEGFTVNPDKNLIQMPTLLRLVSIYSGAFLPDLGRKQWAKSVPPKSDCLVTDIDPAFMKQIFHVAERKWEANVHHNCKANDFG